MLRRHRTRKHKLLLALPTLITLLLASCAVWLKMARTVPQIKFPAAVVPSPNAYDTLVAAGQAYVEPATPVDVTQETKVPPLMPNGKFKEKIYPAAPRDAWLAQNSKTLGLLRKSLQQEYLSPSAQSGGPPYANFSKSRQLARLLVVESHARSLRGDWMGAAQSALDILHLGQQMQRGGAIIDSLVGNAIGAIGSQELWHILPHLNAAQSLAVAQKLGGIETERVSWAEIMGNERVYSLRLTLNQMRSGEILRAVPDWQNGYQEPTWRDRIKPHFMNYGASIERLDAFFKTIISSAKQPYSATQKIRAPACTLTDPNTCQIGDVLLNSRFQPTRDQAGVSLLQVAFALRAYRLQTGRYPATLKALTPLYLKSVPLDPFGNGNTLAYRPTTTSYLLYSWGPDGRDDKGRAIVSNIGLSRRKKNYVSPGSKGDMLANINS